MSVGTNRVGVAAVLVAIGIAILAVALWPSKGDATGDAIADQLGEDVPCPTTREDQAAGDVYEVPAAALTEVREILFITCKGGFVNPGTALVRFDSHHELQQSLQAMRGARAAHNRWCVLETEAFSGSVGGGAKGRAGGFDEVCAELDGQLREPLWR
ncbi:MAG: hypothetical protein WBB30_10925 [Solirubrobacterales bacterium]